MYVRKDAPKCLLLRLLPYRGAEGSRTASQMTRADSRGRPANRPSLGCSIMLGDWGLSPKTDRRAHVTAVAADRDRCDMNSPVCLRRQSPISQQDRKSTRLNSSHLVISYA